MGGQDTGELKVQCDDWGLETVSICSSNSILMGRSAIHQGQSGFIRVKLHYLIRKRRL